MNSNLFEADAGSITDKDADKDGESSDDEHDEGGGKQEHWCLLWNNASIYYGRE
jgi:hypothetical protein